MEEELIFKSQFRSFCSTLIADTVFFGVMKHLTVAIVIILTMKKKHQLFVMFVLLKAFNFFLIVFTSNQFFNGEQL